MNEHARNEHVGCNCAPSIFQRYPAVTNVNLGVCESRCTNCRQPCEKETAIVDDRHSGPGDDKHSGNGDNYHIGHGSQLANTVGRERYLKTQRLFMGSLTKIERKHRVRVLVDPTVRK